MRSLVVTATQRGLTKEQRLAAANFFIRDDVQFDLEVFRHGGCIGGDEELEYLASSLTEALIICHRGDTPEKWADARYSHEFVDPLPNLERNHEMVDDAEHLLACTGEAFEVQRSGTWATIRYARKQGKPITLIFPDGTVKEENGA